MFLANESVEAEVFSVHSNRASMMGGESVYHDYFNETGPKGVLNIDPPLSILPGKAARTRARIEAFFADWKSAAPAVTSIKVGQLEEGRELDKLGEAALARRWLGLALPGVSGWGAPQPDVSRPP